MHKEKKRLYEERTEVFLARLKHELFIKELPFSAEYIHSTTPIPYAQAIKSNDYKKIKEGEHWGSEWDSAWFKLSTDIPTAWHGKKLAAY